MNTITLIGRLTKAPEQQTTSSGTNVTALRLAVNRAGQDGVDFVDVTTFGKLADVCNQYLTKGRRVGVNGRLRYSEWTTDNGTRSKHDVVANAVEFLDGPKTNEQVDGADTEPF